VVRAVAKISRIQGRKLPISILFQAPTIARLAELLRNEELPPQYSSLVPIKTDGSRKPFFGVHLPGELNDFLGSDRPYYSLPYAGVLLDSTEEIARHHLDEIRMIQPAGPHHLGGYAFGAVLAFEMAQQLLSRGEETALLFLLDPTPLKAFNPNPKAITDAWQSVRSRVHNKFAGRSLAQKLANGSALVGQKLWDPLRLLIATFKNKRKRPPSVAQTALLADTTYKRLARRYIPKPYPGPAILVTIDVGSSDDGWAAYLTDLVETHRIETEHLQLTDSLQMAAWGKLLNRSLQ